MTILEEAERAISIGAEHPNAMILGEHCRLVRDELARLRAEVAELRSKFEPWLHAERMLKRLEDVSRKAR